MLLEVIFDSIGEIEQVHCIAPLIWGGIALAALILGTVIVIITTPKDPVPVANIKSKGICILGPELSGKTQLLSALRNVPYTVHESQQQPYKEFEVFLAGEKIKVKAGFDIGGEEFRIKSTYKSFIENSDIIFFTFDAHKYLTDKEYRIEHVNSRLFYIHKHKGNKPTVIFGTHLDKFAEGDRKNIIKRTQDFVKDKPYSTLFEKNFVVMDLRETNKLNEYLKDIIIK
ncbi:MAG: GTPase domain-containing protein [Paludibacteraceae bacterium]|nr:GTPase domain-containing protein [Paludibacteraceae bacterium]